MFQTVLVFFGLMACGSAGRIPVARPTTAEPNSQTSVAPLVSVQVYYETYCPDSQEFIIKQLYPTALAVGTILNVSYIPYGNSIVRGTGKEAGIRLQ